jgi:hypothetical protein
MAKHPPEADSLALKCLAYESLRRVQHPWLPEYCMKIDENIFLSQPFPYESWEWLSSHEI